MIVCHICLKQFVNLGSFRLHLNNESIKQAEIDSKGMAKIKATLNTLKRK